MLYGRFASQKYFYTLGNFHDVEIYENNTDSSVINYTLAQLSIVFLWLAGTFFHIGWSGNFELWNLNPIGTLPIGHYTIDPHFSADKILTTVGSVANHPSYHWLNTVGFYSNVQVFRLVLGLELAAAVSLLLINKRFSLSSVFKTSNISILGFISVAWSLHLLGFTPNFQALGGQYSGSVLNNLNWLTLSSQKLLTFNGGINPETASIPISDISHHHLAIGILLIWISTVLSLISSWLNSTSITQDISTANNVNITSSLNLDLSIALSLLGILTSLLSQQGFVYPCFNYLPYDYLITVSIYVHHQYIAAFLATGGFVHGTIYLIRDHSDLHSNNWVNKILSSKATIISTLSWITLFLGFHTTGLFMHNDAMVAFGFPTKQIVIEPIFAQTIQQVLFLGGSNVYSIGSMQSNSILSFLPVISGGDFLVHHAIALALHTSVLILIKGALDGTGSFLFPDKGSFGYGFACDGPGRGGTCDITAWDSFYLAAFWVLNTVAWFTYYFHWRCLSDWNNDTALFNENSLYLLGWFRDYLWQNCGALISGYDSLGSDDLATWAWAFLLAHLAWAVGFMFLISWRGYWQELIDIVIFMHLRSPFVSEIWTADVVTPVALSIVQARFIGLFHYAAGFIVTYLAFVLASTY